MIFRQLFDYETYTYTYLIADEKTRQAALIDPVIGKVDQYLQLLNELNLKLKIAMDTHVHADHITALNGLRQATAAETYVGKPGDVSCADHALVDGQPLKLGDITIQVIATRGHTDDSYSFYIDNHDSRFVFTGDTLLIRGTGRTDFQNGSADELFDSLHTKLLTLPEDTQVYPGHDYQGRTSSTIAEEKAHNPRINIKTKTEFIDYMKHLNLPEPKYMDVAVPANRNCGNRIGTEGSIRQ